MTRFSRSMPATCEYFVFSGSVHIEFGHTHMYTHAHLIGLLFLLWLRLFRCLLKVSSPFVLMLALFLSSASSYQWESPDPIQDSE